MTEPQRNPEDDVLDAIGALVDRQIAHSELAVDAHQPYCACGREWHGLPERGCPGTPVVGPGRSLAGAPHARAVGNRSAEYADMQVLSAGIGVDPLPADGDQGETDAAIEDMIASAHSRKFFEDMVSVGRARGPARTLSIVEICEQLVRPLGHIVVADEREQHSIFEFPSHVVDVYRTTYQLRRLGPDHHSIEQARAITEIQAVHFLLDANLQLTSELLRRNGIDGMFAHYRDNPIPGPLIGTTTD